MSHKSTITHTELKKYFGTLWEYQHCVNLLERHDYNARYPQASIDWAESEVYHIKSAVEMIHNSVDKEDPEFFERGIEILETLIKG